MASETSICMIICLSLVPLYIVVVRFLQILPTNKENSIDDSRLSSISDKRSSNIAILLGSGGHTGEMMRILDNLDLSNMSRTWITSSGDTTSIYKAKDFEDKLSSRYSCNFVQLPRARKVGEGIILSIYNSIKSLVFTVPALLNLPQLPSILLINGPGTSVPLAYILFMMKFFGICNTKIIYIESLARVNKLSLSGKFILPIADRFIVQWEDLYHKYKRAEYYGILL